MPVHNNIDMDFTNSTFQKDSFKVQVRMAKFPFQKENSIQFSSTIKQV